MRVSRVLHQSSRFFHGTATVVAATIISSETELRMTDWHPPLSFSCTASVGAASELRCVPRQALRSADYHHHCPDSPHRRRVRWADPVQEPSAGWFCPPDTCHTEICSSWAWGEELDTAVQPSRIRFFNSSAVFRLQYRRWRQEPGRIFSGLAPIPTDEIFKIGTAENRIGKRKRQELSAIGFNV